MFLLDVVPPSPMDIIKYGIFQGDLTPLYVGAGIGILVVIILGFIIVKMVFR